MFLSAAINGTSVISNKLWARVVRRKNFSSVGPLGRTCLMMDSRIVKVHEEEDDHLANNVAEVLKNGGVVAIPTDTLYGVAASADNLKAVNKIYDIKKRNLNNALAICVAEVEDVKVWGQTSHCLTPILEDLLPGPVTILLKRTPALFNHMNPGNSLVGIRIPQHKFLRKVVQTLRQPVALTSANISGHASTVDVQEFQELWPLLDLVVDGGRILNSKNNSRSGSTIINLSNEGKFSIVRHGINAEKIIQLLKLKYNLEEF